MMFDESSRLSLATSPIDHRSLFAFYFLKLLRSIRDCSFLVSGNQIIPSYLPSVALKSWVVHVVVNFEK